MVRFFLYRRICFLFLLYVLRKWAKDILFETFLINFCYIFNINLRRKMFNVQMHRWKSRYAWSRICRLYRALEKNYHSPFLKSTMASTFVVVLLNCRRRRRKRLQPSQHIILPGFVYYKKKRISYILVHICICSFIKYFSSFNILYLINILFLKSLLFDFLF